MHARWIAFALLAPLALAGLAFGDDTPPKPKKKRDFDFGDPEPADRPGRPGATAPGAPEGPPADPATAAVKKEVAALATWPARDGVKAAESLLLRGPSVVPFLLEALAGTVRSVQPGAAWVLGNVGEGAHVVPILQAAARLNGYRAEVFFDAARTLEPERTKEWLVGFLSLDRTQLREESTRYLLKILGPGDTTRIAALTESDKAGARIAGLRLLETVSAPDIEDRLTRALSDVAPAVSRNAASLLAARAKEPEVARMNKLAREGESRERAYAVIALADVSRARAANAFEPATVAEIIGRRGLGHPDKLNRVAAAVGLAYGAIESTDPVVAQLVDTTVVDTLVDGLGGEHFRDFESLAEPAFGALRRLSAQDLPSNAVEWAKWWQRERGNFHARRELKALTDSDMPFASVRYESVGADGSRRSATFAPVGSAKAGAYRLPPDIFASLVEALRDVGIFDARPGGGKARADEHVSVTLSVRTLESRVTLAPGDDKASPRYSILRARFESLEEANLWQRYRDTDAWPDERTWREAATAEMGQAEPDVRTDLIRSAIVNAWDDLPNEEARNEALDRLERLGGGPTRAQARILLKSATSVQTMGGVEFRAVGLALAGSSDEETRAAAAEALAARAEPAAVDLLAGLLAQGGVERVRDAFADARAPVRQAAARAAAILIDRTDADLDPDGTVKLGNRLLPGLEVLRKDEPRVRIQALLALVRLGDTTVMPEFDTIYEQGDLGTKVRVTEAMGSVPGDKSHGLLTRVLAEPGEGGGALRAAALRSMARTNHPNAVRLLLYYMLIDLEPEVMQAAGDALVDLGSDEARFAVVTALTKGEDNVGRRARLVDVLGRFSGQVVEEVLQRQLDDTAPEVVGVAALRAGEKGLPAAVPHLIALLRRGNDSERDRALVVLEELTCQRIAAPGYGVKADQYDAWWATAKAGTDRVWFRDALVARGYDVGPLIPYVRGEPGFTPVPVLLRVLRDEDPSLRNAAARALERLSGRSFGAVGRGVPAPQWARVATAWSEWWEHEGRTGTSGR